MTAQPISPLRIAGAAITLVGFLLAVAGPNLRLRPAIDRPAGGSENSGDSEKSETDGKAVHVPGSATVLWSCAGIAFGMCSAVQTAFDVDFLDGNATLHQLHDILRVLADDEDQLLGAGLVDGVDRLLDGPVTHCSVGRSLFVRWVFGDASVSNSRLTVPTLLFCSI